MKKTCLSVIIGVSLLLCCALGAQSVPVDPALANPTFERNIYAIGINGDWSAVALVNSLWYASPETARALARKLYATATAEPTSPQTGFQLTRWKIVQVPDGPMVAKIQALIWRNGYIAEKDLRPYMDLPAHGMQVLRLSADCRINAGYLAGYYARNPPSLFPGLADRYLGQIVRGECGYGGLSLESVVSAPVRGPVKLAKKIAGKKKYESFWADGKEPKFGKPPKKGK